MSRKIQRGIDRRYDLLEDWVSHRLFETERRGSSDGNYFSTGNASNSFVRQRRRRRGRCECARGKASAGLISVQTRVLMINSVKSHS